MMGIKLLFCILLFSLIGDILTGVVVIGAMLLLLKVIN